MNKAEKIQIWFNLNEPEDTCVYKKTWWKNNMFIRDELVYRLFNDGQAEIVGTHFSKSIECPVIKIYYKGVEILWQYNFYNWQIMIKSNKDLELDDLELIGANCDYFYYQGIPTDYQFKPYSETNKKEFAISTHSNLYDVFAFAVELKKAIDKINI